MAVYHDHGVGDRAEIEKHEGRVSQLLGHRGEDRIWQEIVSRLVQSHPEAPSDLRTMMPLWGPSLGEFVDDLQVTPKKGGLELGKLCKLLEPALPYCREQVCSHEWEGQEEEIRHCSVWNDKDGKADGNKGEQ